MDDITVEYYMHAQRASKDFEIKNVASHHDLYVPGDTLLLVSVFENLCNIFRKVFKADHAHFISAPGLAW